MLRGEREQRGLRGLQGRRGTPAPVGSEISVASIRLGPSGVLILGEKKVWTKSKNVSLHEWVNPRFRSLLGCWVGNRRVIVPNGSRHNQPFGGGGVVESICQIMALYKSSQVQLKTTANEVEWQ